MIQFNTEVTIIVCHGYLTGIAETFIMPWCRSTILDFHRGGLKLILKEESPNATREPGHRCGLHMAVISVPTMFQYYKFLRTPT